MGDVTTVEYSPILFRLTEIYMNLCEVAADMRLQMNFKRRADMRESLTQFRRLFYELYYLVRIKEGFDEDLSKEIEEWQRVTFTSDVPMKFYLDSLSLFDRTTVVMKNMGLVKL